MAEYFLALAGDPPKILSARAQHSLETHSWPGNVRELRNAIERATILARGATIEAEDLGLTDSMVHPTPSATTQPLHNLPTALAQLEEDMIRAVLAETDGNRAEAARRLGIRRQLLYAKLNHYGIEP